MSPRSLLDAQPLRRLRFEPATTDKLTHYLFRYPAKFHPPVVRHLLEEYTAEGDTVLDPFCGSGTLLVEAAVLGRHAIGTDVDPVAVFASRVKTHAYTDGYLRSSADGVLKNAKPFRRSASEYDRRQHDDVTAETVLRTIREEGLWAPTIPNIYHWFRKYVVVDLARILYQIKAAQIPQSHKEFLLLCFASIIRGASNADPVPVSGLEVTSHMKRRDDEGRTIDPFQLFEKAVTKALAASASFAEQKKANTSVRVFAQDATRLTSRIRRKVDAIITSPPYNGAVDYYRRHTLEMYWLGFTSNTEERLALLPKYIGRDKVPQSHPFVADNKVDAVLVKSWEDRIRRVRPRRADAFKHYAVAMSKVLHQFSEVLPSGGCVLLVLGHSAWNGQTIPTSRLFATLAGPRFKLRDYLWYPVSNRYMSYDRHNGADINKEYVLRLERT